MVGTPDFALTYHRMVLMAHSCFWHYCRHHGRLPKIRRAWWRAKLLRNRQRDRRVARDLRAADGFLKRLQRSINGAGGKQTR